MGEAGGASRRAGFGFRGEASYFVSAGFSVGVGAFMSLPASVFTRNSGSPTFSMVSTISPR